MANPTTEQHDVESTGVREQLKPSDESGSESGRPKKKQKRNKPTLSCFDCVDRKTKVSQAKP
jgi:hypothetical protein